MNPPPADRLAPVSPPVGRLLRLLLLVATFCSGAAVGGAGGAFWMRERLLTTVRHPEGSASRASAWIRAQLDLTEDEARRVEEIVQRRHSRMESIRAESHPLLVAEFDGICTEIAAALPSDRRAKWAEVSDSVRQRYLPSAPVGPPPADVIFQRFDANGDGALSEEEVPPMMWHRLGRADANRDGKVTLEEYHQARQQATGER